MYINHLIENQYVISERPWFTSDCYSHRIELKAVLPDMERIVSSISIAEVSMVRIIKTPTGCSCEGQNLTGKQAVVEIEIKSKILYSSLAGAETLYMLETCIFESACVVLPGLIEGTDPEALLNAGQIDAKVLVAGEYLKRVNNRTILYNISLLAGISKNNNGKKIRNTFCTVIP